MTNKLRSVGDRSGAAPASQAETQAGASKASSGAVGFVLKATNGDLTISCFDLTAAELSRLQAASSKWADSIPGRIVSDFIREALLKAANRELFPGRPMGELEEAVAQAKGLLNLALEHQCFVLEENDKAFGRERSMELVTLCNSTVNRLRSAFEGAWSYAAGRAA